MELIYDPHIVKAVRNLTDLGMTSTEIADTVGISRHTVMKVQKHNEITPARQANGAPPHAGPPRAELVAAARPWAQFRWSAKEGPSW